MGDKLDGALVFAVAHGVSPAVWCSLRRQILRCDDFCYFSSAGSSCCVVIQSGGRKFAHCGR